MSTWQERVGVERAQLADRTSGLIKFMCGAQYKEMSPVIRGLLEAQLNVMKSYLVLLDARLSIGADDTPAPSRATG